MASSGLPDSVRRPARPADPARIVVTGGAGFIGSALCRHLVLDAGAQVLNVDCLTYAGNPNSLRGIEGHPGYRFLKADIRNRTALDDAFAGFRPDAVMHLAAESHVDRSIGSPADFADTNVMDTGPGFHRSGERPSGSFTSPPTRSTGRSARTACSRRPRPTTPPPPMPPPRRRRTTSSRPGAAPMACRS
jgi:hypothetical protein